MTSVAAAATGAVVGGGVLSAGVTDEAGAAQLAAGSINAPVQANAADPSDDTTADAANVETDELLAEREATTSRSDTRTETDPLKAVALSSEAGPAVSGQEDASDRDPRELGQMLLAEFGFGADQWSCLDSLWTKESNWGVTADNPTSSAYGIPQALPGRKMASAGADWETNPVTQIRWGLGYIENRYGTPCSAWAHSQANNWY